MSAPRPSPLALALFDRFVPDDDPLRGDLLEEFAARRSQWWLWRQVIGAAICRRPLAGRGPTSVAGFLGLTLLLLASFEAVFAANIVQRLVFGPDMPGVAGYALLCMAASIPAGRLIGGVHQQHTVLAVVLFTLTVSICAVLNLGSPFPFQFLTMSVFVLGMLAGGAWQRVDTRLRSR